MFVARPPLRPLCCLLRRVKLKFRICEFCFFFWHKFSDENISHNNNVIPRLDTHGRHFTAVSMTAVVQTLLGCR